MRRHYLLTLGLLLLIGCRSLAQPTPPGLYLPAPGPLAIATRTDLKLHDAARGKDLPVTAIFPTAEGKYPVIVWSHGFGGSPQSYSTYSTHWASEGYVVLLPTHADSLSLRPGPPDWSRLGPGVVQLMRDPPQWLGRLADIKLVLDSLPDLHKQAPELAGKLDGERLGVGGHSFGAWTAEVIGGATITLPGQTQAQSFADPRVKAVVGMSATTVSQMGLTRSSWEQVTLPLLTMDGTRDPSLTGLGPDAKKLAFDLSPPGNKFHVRLEGGTHFAFNDFHSGRPGELAMGREEHDRLESYADTAALAFWDAYLKGKPEARAYLESDALPQASGQLVMLFRR